jgi:hypothetical protein
MADLKSRGYIKVYGKVEKLADYRVKWLARLVYSDAFEMVIAFVIVVNANPHLPQYPSRCQAGSLDD